MDRVIERIIALLTSNMKTERGIKRIYNGHPMHIPKDSMPSIVVRGVSMRSEILDTTRNQEVFTVEVMLVADARDYMNAQLEESTVEREVRKIVEERTSGGNELESDTILGVLEKNLLYDDTYNLNLTVTNIQFGAGLDPIFTTEFPSFYGILTVEIRAIPHSVRTP